MIQRKERHLFPQPQGPGLRREYRMTPQSEAPRPRCRGIGWVLWLALLPIFRIGPAANLERSRRSAAGAVQRSVRRGTNRADLCRR